MLATRHLNVPDLAPVSVVFPLVAFLFQLADEVERVVNRVDYAVVIAVARFVVGAGLEPETHIRFCGAFANQAVHNAVGFVVVGGAEFFLPPPERPRKNTHPAKPVGVVKANIESR